MRSLISKIVVISCTTLGGLPSVFGAVNLVWDSSPDTQLAGAVAGYKVYYGPMNTEIITTGLETNAIAALVAPNRLYNFSVVAFDAHGTESQFSNFLPFFTPGHTTTNVNLTWDHSPDAAIPGAVAGYKLRYGYASSVRDVGLSTHFYVTDIPIGKPYFFAVTAYSPSGQESDPSNVVIYMNSGTVPTNPHEVIAPPVIAAFSFTPAFSSETSGGSSPINPNGSAVLEDVIGIPPLIIPTTHSNLTQLTVWGSMGANLTVQKSVNPASLNSWTTVTNITLETAVQSPGTQSGSFVPTIVQKAFAPAIATWEMQRPDSPFVLYRLIQQQDYEVLADKSLREQGYNTRLVVVRLAGNFSYTLCYVAEERAFLHYDAKTQTVIRQPSGESLREIADLVSALLKVNWTSASEFVMVGNQRQMGTTVMKTAVPTFTQPQSF